MFRIYIATAVIMMLPSCSFDNLFQQSGSTSNADNETATGNEDTGGAFAEYPEGLLNGAEIAITEGETVANDVVAGALSIDEGVEIESVGTSVNFAADQDLDDAQLGQLQINVPLPEGSSLQLLADERIVVFYHVRRPDGSFSFGVIGFSDLKIKDSYARVSARGFGNYQTARLNKAIETKTVQTTSKVRTKKEAEEEDKDDDNSSPTEKSGTYSLTLSYPTTDRWVFVDDETGVRTVTISHNGDSIECSRDGGSTYSSCSSSTTFVWHAGDYSDEHAVRVTGSAKNSKSETFKPSELFPGLEFVNCTSDITSAGSGDFDSFVNQASFAAGAVVCIADGLDFEYVTATDGGDTYDKISISYDDVVIIAREGHTVNFETDLTSGYVFDNVGKSGVKIVGVNIRLTGSGSYGIRTTSSANGNLYAHVGIETTINSFAMYFFGSGSNSDPNDVYDVEIDHVAAGSGAGIYAYGGHTMIDQSTIKSDFLPLNFTNGADVALDSVEVKFTRNTSDSSDGAIELGKDVTVSIENSKVQVAGGVAVLFGASATAGQDSTFETSGVTYIRTDDHTNGDNPVIRADGTFASNNTHEFVIDSDSNENYFCHEADSTGQRFSSVIALQGGNSNGGTFNLSNQENSGSIIVCPAGTSF